MIYHLSSFGGRSDVIGQLREFEFKDEALSIKGLTLQDARNVLAVLATGEVGVPITYGGILKEIANPTVPGEIQNSALVQVTGQVERKRSAVKAEPEPVTPESEVRSAFKEPESAKKQSNPAAPKPVEKASMDDGIKPPTGVQIIDLSAAAKGDWVTSDLPPAAPAEPADHGDAEPANVLQLEPVATTAKQGFDPSNIPEWASSAKTMRVLAMSFHKEWGVPYNDTGVETMYQACVGVKDKVPFFATPNLQSRLAAIVETLSDD